MILQTGGGGVGATSTKSSPGSRAIRRASEVEVLPTFSSLSLIKKIGEMRICSLWRKFVEIAILQKTTSAAGAFVPDHGCCLIPEKNKPQTLAELHPRTNPLKGRRQAHCSVLIRGCSKIKILLLDHSGCQIRASDW